MNVDVRMGVWWIWGLIKVCVVSMLVRFGMYIFKCVFYVVIVVVFWLVLFGLRVIVLSLMRYLWWSVGIGMIDWVGCVLLNVLVYVVLKLF